MGILSSWIRRGTAKYKRARPSQRGANHLPVTAKFARSGGTVRDDGA